jgi:hypothetical protein
MDLFSPFAPTTVDRDFKAGDDLIQIEKLNDDGSDVQLLAVGRRDDQGRITGQAHSVAGKWHGFAAGGEIELVAGKHYVDQVYAFAVRYPLGGALLRSDWVATRLRSGDWKLSAIVNLDYSLNVNEHNVYVFGEYFYNGFGVDDLPASPVLLPEPLQERLTRGEVFSLMKHYTAIGASVEWHPLVTQTLTLITNLTDLSHLIQTQVTYNPGDHQMLEAGIVFSLGHPGEEFGGVPLAGSRLTSGGGTQGYLRWVWYF